MIVEENSGVSGSYYQSVNSSYHGKFRQRYDFFYSNPNSLRFLSFDSLLLPQPHSSTKNQPRSTSPDIEAWLDQLSRESSYLSVSIISFSAHTTSLISPASPMLNPSSDPNYLLTSYSVQPRWEASTPILPTPLISSPLISRSRPTSSTPHTDADLLRNSSS